MTKLLRRKDGILIREVDRELLILDTNRDKVHQLNETASFVWRNIDDLGSVEAISALLAESYATDPSTVVGDVIQVVRRLVELGLVSEKQ